ncbi:MAG: hypothetical protein ACRDRP_02640 [Pseudonocardiaceae bacterium]
MPAAGGHIQPSYPAFVLWAGWEAAIRWWDGVELWLTQLGFVVQVVLLMLVLLPVCWWAARVIDRVFGLAFDRFGHRYAVGTGDIMGDVEEPR